MATGPSAQASGNVHPSETVSKVAFDALIKEAQRALVDDQERLDQIADGLSEGMWQILTQLRKLEFAVASVAEVQTQIKNSVDETAVAAIATKLKAKGSGNALEVMKVLLGSVVTAEIAKHFLGQ